MVMDVVDDVIGDAPLYPSALLSRVLRHEFSLLSITYNIVGGYHRYRVLERSCKLSSKKLVDNGCLAT